MSDTRSKKTDGTGGTHTDTAHEPKPQQESVLKLIAALGGLVSVGLALSSMPRGSRGEWVIFVLTVVNLLCWSAVLLLKVILRWQDRKR